MNKLSIHIALRYLFARKSHSVINRISAISAVGMAVGTAALIIILSIYNGFDSIVKSMISSVEPDFAIVPTAGKFFIPEEEMLERLDSVKKIESVCKVLQDNVFVEYDGHQGTVVVKGVDETYSRIAPISGHLTDGEFKLAHGEIRYAAVGRQLARNMDLDCNFVTPLKLYYPNADAAFSAASPMSSVNMVRVWPSCEFSVNATLDATLVLVSMDVMQHLMGMNDEVSSLEVRVTPGLSKLRMYRLRRELSSMLGRGVNVLDRVKQNPTLYRMLKYEKLSVYLIMVFIVLILGFSIFGSLSMLIIEKEGDIATLRAMGADSKMVHSIFTLEGWFITLLGMVVGMICGICFCLLQQKYGLIKMPGVYVVEYYPVIIEWTDVLVAVLSISAAGYLIALLPTRRLKAGKS